MVIPRGHGPVVDLHQDTNLGRILAELDDRGGLIGAVCHGPAGLLSAVRPDGTWWFAGRWLTAFTDEEEELFGTAEGAPWLLASRVGERGAHHEDGAAFE